VCLRRHDGEVLQGRHCGGSGDQVKFVELGFRWDGIRSPSTSVDTAVFTLPEPVCMWGGFEGVLTLGGDCTALADM